MRRFDLVVDVVMSDDTGILNVPRLPELSNDEFEWYDGREDSFHIRGVNGKAPNSLKETMFSLKQFVEIMGQPNYTAFGKGNNVPLSGVFDNTHRHINQGQNDLKSHWDGPPHM